ncbi:hypothetical protein FHW84_002778 [Dyella sp. SG562]|uniref:PepSY domain-containing protein n=1 Tax=Dyella sp. SG562 TaxID=2587017 RepID=UPI00142123E2|nr:PepSY domain-containing protein [Dyella sp. SG562]NII74193.1 hypothetical protein [Dyella sp. SG562]
MGTEQRENETKGLHVQASRATINGYRLGLVTFVVSTFLSIFGPAISSAVNKQTPVFIGWLAAKWSLPWPVIVMLVFLGLWIGRWAARRELMTQMAFELRPDPPPKAKPTEPPAPETLNALDRRILQSIARSDGWTSQDHIAFATDEVGVGLQAALIRLRSLRLITAVHQRGGTVFWRLTDEGVLYVDRHTPEIMRNPGTG